ncbi:MAG: asparagine--tRNA ligase [Candidatus Freyarchaeota archaeon]|nr:asparagine--tRNA ligase [Candidatus Jordarchaeia archaeon]MBS7269044.1 asparagine--tRNA ligase [Candidatus Jordarchaeia archaeon]MBS7278625.1 asparagine--tRNA ligase [Candidatus Jordarchaeia archaeon]
MEKVVRISHIEKYVGESVQIRGWIHLKREHGKHMLFLVVRDGTGFIQVVLRDTVKGYDEVSKSYREAAVIITGNVIEDRRSPYGYEIRAESVKVISPSQPTIEEELQPDSSVDVLLDKRHLVIRGEKASAVLRYTDKLLRYIREFCVEKGLTEVVPPIITKAACEGGATLFPVKYFDETAYLTQSSQLYLEAVLPALGNVYCIQKSFRAEQHRTRRHLLEYYHFEPELAFIDFEDLIRFAEENIVHIVKRTLEEDYKILELFGVEDLEVPRQPFRRLTYAEALEFFKSMGVVIEPGMDIEESKERMLVDHFGEPVFLTEFPAEQKAFYFKRKETDESVALAVDLLVPTVGEIIGGGMREDDYDKIILRLKEIKANLDDYRWYTDFRKYGSVPHGGYGLGIERTVEWILRLEHIRDATLFPRFVNRLLP